MSLDLNPDALAAVRETFNKRDARASLSAGESAGREDRVTFADQLRASQMRADQADRQSDIQKTNQDSAPDYSQNSAPAAPPAQKDQTDVRPPQAAKAEADKPIDAQKNITAPEAKTEADPVDVAASETVTPDTAVQTEPAVQITPEQALAATAQPGKAVSTDAKIAEVKPVDLTPEVEIPTGQIDALAQALSTLRSALKTQTDRDVSKIASDSAPEAETTDKTADAQIDQLMQALLSGKPLTPELKALSETPKVAEALKAVGNALSALDQKGLDAGQAIEAALVVALKGEELEPKVLGDAKPVAFKPDLSPNDLKAAIPAASPVVNEEQTSLAQAKPETVTSQTALGDVSDKASSMAAKSSDLPVDFKPAPAPAEAAPLMPATAQAAAKAADALQLTRSEAALGSSLSTVALNNLTQMSAQIARHMTAKSTQFNMELHPADMGRVDVKLSINHDGSLSAALSFDSPVAESQFRAQADELRRQLEAQGFQLAEGSLSFSSRQNSDQAPQGQSASNNAPAFGDETPDAARAAQAFGAFDHMPDAPAPGALLAQKLGLDLLGAQTYRLSLNVTA